MRPRVVGLLVLSWSTLARADDPRDVFGLDKKPAPSQPAPSQPAPNQPAPSQPAPSQPAPSQPAQPQGGTVRDVFGLGTQPTANNEPLDCSTGTLFGCTTATDLLDIHAEPYALTQWLSSPYLLSLPTANATHNQVAHYALGAGQDEAGPTFGGATGLENRWLINGAPADSLRTGVAGTRVPLTFLDGMWVTAGGFTARDRVSTGGQINAILRSATPDHELEVHGWAGWTADERQRAILANTYYTRRGTLQTGPEAQLLFLATGPLHAVGDALGGSAWYVAGVAPEIDATKFTWNASTLTDIDNDGTIDGLPGVVSLEPVERTTRTPVTWRVPLLLRGGFDRGAHHLDLNVVGTVGTDVFYLYNSTIQAAGIDGTMLEGDAFATWQGRWTHTRATAQLAWHRTNRWESARDPAAANIPQQLSAYVPVPLAEDPALSAACADDMPDAPVPSDKYPKITNCPVPFGWFTSGGAGALTDVTGDRPSVTVDVAHQIGNNVVRAGATGEDTRLVNETRFTGGTQIRSLFAGHMAERRFADPDQLCSTDVALPCPTVDKSVLSYRTRYTAAYLEDTWNATPHLSVNGGVRWELMWVGTVLHFSDQFAPRLGISWDPLGGGQSRVWASMGRSYAYLPAGLGPTIIRSEKTVDRITSMFGEGRSVQTGTPVPVAPDVEPIAQDEATAGAELAYKQVVRATMWLQGRWLRRGLDTMPNGFDNPGRYGGTPAIRDTGIFAAEIATAPTSKLALRVGYMYGRTIGSWTGAFDPRQGAVLYAGSDFDTRAVNLVGLLPTDLGHRTYIEAERSGRVGSAKLVFAMRLTAANGRPRNVVADSDEGTIFLIPRGSAGRAPVLTQANMRVGAQWRGLDITLDLFNVFDRRVATSVDETFAAGSIRPIDQGELSDLVFLKTESGNAAQRRPSYGTATAFQTPFAAFLGVRHAF